MTAGDTARQVALLTDLVDVLTFGRFKVAAPDGDLPVPRVEPDAQSRVDVLLADLVDVLSRGRPYHWAESHEVHECRPAGERIARIYDEITAERIERGIRSSHSTALPGGFL